MQKHTASRIIAIQGPPRSGKTTIVEKVAFQYRHISVGFITKEVRNTRHIRIGFDILCLPQGPRLPLARVDWAKTAPYRVGKYGVHPDRIRDALVWIDAHIQDRHLLIIDELGKMESYSDAFCPWLNKMLSRWSGWVLMTLPVSIPPPFRKILNHFEYKVMPLSQKNRDKVYEHVCQVLSHAFS